jgi:RNA polymerase sigma factor (sigma-70 family)
LDMANSANRAQEEVLNRLVAEYQGALLRLCYAYLHDRALAEDALQETFLKAYRNLGQFRGESSEKTWLVKIAVNTCRDLRRSGWFLHMDRSITPDMLPEPSVPTSQQDKEITAEVMRLPVKLREVVLLYYFQSMSTVDVAQSLGITQQAVSARLLRARAKLRYVLEGR